MIRLRVEGLDKALEQAAQVPERAVIAQREIAAILAKRIAEAVRDRIPRDGGWLDIYRDSIEFVELEPGSYGVAGVAEVPFSRMEAERTLLWFQTGDQATQILSQYNPWTIDAVPAVAGGIYADVIVRPASESEVAHHRRRLAGGMAGVVALLQRLGLRVEDNGLPQLNGKVYADLDFLSRRLEFGLGGFPRVAHWLPAVADAERIANSAEVKEALARAMGKGESSTKTPKADARTAASIKKGEGS